MSKMFPRVLAPLHPLLTKMRSLPAVSKRTYVSEPGNKIRSKLRNPRLFREQAYINGRWTDGRATSRFSVVNPYNGKVIGNCPEMDVSDTTTAIEKAQHAFESFRHSSARQRMGIIRDWFQLMQEHEDDLAIILSHENGRPIEAAKAEIKYAASFFEWFQGEAVRSYGQTVQGSSPENRVMTIKQPIGVVGVLTPWNFPSAMITRKAGAAIAAGCTTVLKPAADTPYSALALAELGEQAGIPPGVFNIVTTEQNVAAVGKQLCEHPTVKKISFTGSTNVGKLLMQQCGDSLKKMSMELGGNAPFVIFDDADMNKAWDGLLAAKFRGAGQTCVCANRVYIQESIADKFIEDFHKLVGAKMVAGDPSATGTSLGPLINLKAREKVERLVKDAREKGAVVVAGGHRSQDEPQTFFPATILDRMSHDMQASREELFGPVVAFYRFKDETELLRMANDSEVGLASYVYTEQLTQAWRAAELLQTGMVGINTGMISDPVAPFGGIKQSGFGREGGSVGIEEFQNVKTITLGGVQL
ncbi:succinate-semialdehyde dehydrogenase-like protein [Paraphaeosphaeria sporulosa]|uniref:succinate-semialdehyde dehydrogenase [NAD(P)(+)] n=1 Tax=Paraphaeosphaeria sporulosa TaxID=1460663 RepID=A0A177C3A4_9PLEO|nr:succinate-semialdehyde dehydrogenase-like protein [Paraphaeosphaeria sporulosa]OAG02224.1 succinate-semialdehyde dehydrogenase-like protein [Paraphaeosphaeria sporulosa]